MAILGWLLIALGALIIIALFVLWLGSLLDDRDQGRSVLEAWNEDLPVSWGNSDEPATTRRRRPF